MRRPLFHLDNGEIDLTERFQVGVITTPHGLKGEVKVFPTTDDPGRFRVLRELILKEKKSERVLKVRSVKFFKQFVILGFEGLNRIEDVEQLRGCSLLVERKDAVPLEENEYYIADLIGMEVVTDDGKKLGVLDDVLQTGANDVYVVKAKDGKEILLPVIDECILDVSLEENRVTAHVLPGLLD